MTLFTGLINDYGGTANVKTIAASGEKRNDLWLKHLCSSFSYKTRLITKNPSLGIMSLMIVHSNNVEVSTRQESAIVEGLFETSNVFQMFLPRRQTTTDTNPFENISAGDCQVVNIY